METPHKTLAKETTEYVLASYIPAANKKGNVEDEIREKVVLNLTSVLHQCYEPKTKTSFNHWSYSQLTYF